MLVVPARADAVQIAAPDAQEDVVVLVVLVVVVAERDGLGGRKFGLKGR